MEQKDWILKITLKLIPVSLSILNKKKNSTQEQSQTYIPKAEENKTK